MHTLLNLRGKYTYAMANLAQEGILFGSANKISLRCLFKLHNRSVINKSINIDNESAAFVVAAPSVASSREEADIFFQNVSLICPRCNQTRGNSHIWPRSGARWAEIPCTESFCTFIAPAHKWKCNCNISWQACKLHARWPDICAAFFPAASNHIHTPLRPRPSIPSGSFHIHQHIYRKATSASVSNPPSTSRSLVRLPGRQRAATGAKGRGEKPGAVVTKELSRTTILPPSHFVARALTPKLAAKFPRLCMDLPQGEYPHST
jgi:hypothetical protein